MKETPIAAESAFNNQLLDWLLWTIVKADRQTLVMMQKLETTVNGDNGLLNGFGEGLTIRIGVGI
jgi:hypothetical protein